MKITVIGCGYLGAVHAACMASIGHEVLGIDVSEAKVAGLNSGQAPFYEPGFSSLLERSLATGRLRFTAAPSVAELSAAQLHFITVGTPQSETGAADLSYVAAALDTVRSGLSEGAQPVVVGKSTVPVGTAGKLAEELAAQGVSLVWNPEFLREGFAVEDTLRPDRIVYGLSSDPELAERGRNALDEVYAPLLAQGIPQVVTDYATAELVKVAANSFLATKISFINAMAELCEATGGDVTQLAKALGYDNRIGHRFLGAGLGFGGGCLPKDIRAFVARAEELGVADAVSFLKQVDAINLRRRDRVVNLAQDLLSSNLKGAQVTVLGASFKPNSDDIRDSPALDVAWRLHELGAKVTVCDPKALELAAQRFPQLGYEPEAESALRGADLVLLLTEWTEFVLLDPQETKELVRNPVIVDGRNALDPSAWREAGWDYHGLGR